MNIEMKFAEFLCLRINVYKSNINFEEMERNNND